MTGADPEDSTIKKLAATAATFKGSWCGDPNAIPPDGSMSNHWPQHSYVKFISYVQQAENDLSSASANAHTTAGAASQYTTAATGNAATINLTQYIQDVANHIESAGQYFSAMDAAQAYASVLQMAKKAIVAYQEEANTGYKNGGTVMSSKKTNHETSKGLNPSGPCQGEVYQCSGCGGASISSGWQSTLQAFNQFCENQVKLVESARQEMLTTLRAVVTSGTGGQAAAQAAQTGQGAMSGMDASAISSLFSGVGQILQVPASMVSNLAQQGSGLISSLASQIASAAAQGGSGAAPTSAQEKDDVTVVKKQGPKLGEFITNQKKPATIVTSAPGGSAGNSPANAAKPTVKARPKPVALKVNFDPDSATGWGTTAASADIQGPGHKATVRVPFKINKG